MRKSPALRWVYVADDDVYVRVDRLREELAKWDPTGLHGPDTESKENRAAEAWYLRKQGKPSGRGMVLAQLGCQDLANTSHQIIWGICGGGGWAEEQGAPLVLDKTK